MEAKKVVALVPLREKLAYQSHGAPDLRPRLDDRRMMPFGGSDIHVGQKKRPGRFPGAGLSLLYYSALMDGTDQEITHAANEQHGRNNPNQYRHDTLLKLLPSPGKRRCTAGCSRVFLKVSGAASADVAACSASFAQRPGRRGQAASWPQCQHQRRGKQAGDGEQGPARPRACGTDPADQNLNPSHHGSWPVLSR